MKQLSPAQEDINNMINVLRLEKESVKEQISDLNDKITEIDQLILNLRQSFSLNEPEQKPKRKTHEEKLQRRLDEVTKELDELKAKLGVNQ